MVINIRGREPWHLEFEISHICAESTRNFIPNFESLALIISKIFILKQTDRRTGIDQSTRLVIFFFLSTTYTHIHNVIIKSLHKHSYPYTFIIFKQINQRMLINFSYIYLLFYIPYILFLVNTNLDSRFINYN